LHPITAFLLRSISNQLTITFSSDLVLPHSAHQGRPERVHHDQGWSVETEPP
jgi:hypothetical protein